MADLKSMPHHSRAHRKGDKRQWVCRVCESLDGVASSEVMTVTTAPMVNDKGRLTGGTKQVVCAHCWARGRRTLAP